MEYKRQVLEGVASSGDIDILNSYAKNFEDDFITEEMQNIVLEMDLGLEPYVPTIACTPEKELIHWMNFYLRGENLKYDEEVFDNEIQCLEMTQMSCKIANGNEANGVNLYISDEVVKFVELSLRLMRALYKDPSKVSEYFEAYKKTKIVKNAIKLRGLEERIVLDVLGSIGRTVEISPLESM